MIWLEICIDTTPEGVEPLSDRLAAIGADGVSIEDEQDFLNFLENNRQYWDYVDEELRESMRGICRVKYYVPDDDEGNAMCGITRDALCALRADRPDIDFGSLKTTVSKQDDADWAESWKKYFKPLPVGNRILIKPEWEETGNPDNRVVLNINPGLLFGSGTHTTTQLCLEQLEKYIKPGSRMLDFGCGSGILSVMSVLLGAGEAVGVDIDRNAPEVMRKNAEINNLEPDKIKVYVGDILSDRSLAGELQKVKYDVITANIVADVIIGIADGLRPYMADGGIFIASGIIDTRAHESATALAAAGLAIVETVRRDGWCAVVAR